jgi:hypothetical protein
LNWLPIRFYENRHFILSRQCCVLLIVNTNHPINI